MTRLLLLAFVAVLLAAVAAANAQQSGAHILTAAQEQALKPKDAFKECDICPAMVVVPAGSFTMGVATSEARPGFFEDPQRAITIAAPFAVGRFAVSFDEWDACAAGGGCGGYRPSDQGWGRGRRPVINVSWDDAKAYVAWLSKTTGRQYRLLTEAEREFVTRAGTTTPFWWGASITTDQANYEGKFAFRDGPKGIDRDQTLPVDSFEPNPWGLYQVHGNVWEWVEDCFGRYSEAPTDGSAAVSGQCRFRTMRGGSFQYGPVLLQSTSRSRGPTDFRGRDLGLRVARTLMADSGPGAVSTDDRNRCLTQADDVDAVIVACTRLLASDQTSSAQRVDAFINRAYGFIVKDDYDRAIADASEALKLGPDAPRAYLALSNRGFAYQAKGDLEPALADFNRSIALRPSFVDPYESRALLFESKGDYDRALADFNEAVRLRPQAARLVYERGRLQVLAKKLDLAAADFTAAARLNPNFFEAWANLGVVFVLSGDCARAIENFNAALKLDSNSATIYANRAYCFEQQGHRDAALADFRAALELNARDQAAIEGVERLEQRSKPQ